MSELPLDSYRFTKVEDNAVLDVDVNGSIYHIVRRKGEIEFNTEVGNVCFVMDHSEELHHAESKGVSLATTLRGEVVEFIEVAVVEDYGTITISVNVDWAKGTVEATEEGYCVPLACIVA
jgi:hypothetical protein